MLKAIRLVATLGLVVGLSQAALAQSSPTTITPDRAQVLVNKDIAGQRWAIARNVSNGAVTGNVFTPGSNDPQFVYCEQTGETSSDYNYRCSGMGRCTVSDCATAWNFVSQVALPKSFFAAGGPAPTPVPSSGLQGLIGTWRFDFAILGVPFSYTFRLQQIVTLSSGIQAIRGVDSGGGTVAALRIRDALPSSTLPYEFYLQDPGTIICGNYFFNRSGDTIDGVYAQADVVGGECGDISSNLYPLSGSRTSMSASVASATDPSSTHALEREVMMQAGAAMDSGSDPDLKAAVDEFLRSVGPVQ